MAPISVPVTDLAASDAFWRAIGGPAWSQWVAATGGEQARASATT